MLQNSLQAVIMRSSSYQLNKIACVTNIEQLNDTKIVLSQFKLFDHSSVHNIDYNDRPRKEVTVPQTFLKEAWVAKFQACDHHRSETCCLVSQYPPTFLLHKIGAYNSRNISSNINTLEQTAHTISIKLQLFDICMSYATKLLRLPMPCDCPNLSNYLNGSF